jgi:hypothetical protein
MSIHFQAWRVPKVEFWPFHAALRERYLAEHWMSKVITTLVPNMSPEKATDFLLRLSDGSFEEQATTELQLFDEGDVYLFRVLEWGNLHFFRTQFATLSAERGWDFEDLHLNTSTDIPAEDQKNFAVVDWFEEELKARRYQLVHVVDMDDWGQRMLELRLSQPADPYPDAEVDERLLDLTYGIDPAKRRACPLCAGRERELRDFTDVYCSQCDALLLPEGVFADYDCALSELEAGHVAFVEGEDAATSLELSPNAVTARHAETLISATSDLNGAELEHNRSRALASLGSALRARDGA